MLRVSDLPTAFCLCFLYVSAVQAQLPEMAAPSTLSGAPTSARFYAGVTADGGASYAGVHGFADPVDIITRIQVEPAHVNTVGNLYVVIQLQGQLHMGLESGEFVLWDEDPSSLQPIRSAKTLQANEDLTLVEDLALGPIGISDTTLDIYLAYDSMAAPDELFYSGSPLTFTIESEPVQAQSLTLYQANISQQIIQTRCILCHVSGGVAGATPLTYLNSSQPDFLQTNYNTIAAFVQNVPEGTDLLLSNPQGISHGGGVQLAAGSSEFGQWIEFVNALDSELNP